jgi:ArsR family transcriptional regulator
MKTDSFLKCIVDDNRRNIIKFLGKKEKCVCEIVEHLNLEQSLISHHLKMLKECGLLNTRQDGKNIFYKVSDEKISDVLKQIDKVSSKISMNKEC